jgi:hypothetical protein
MRIAVWEARKTAEKLQQKENDARYHTAKGSGKDYVIINGKPVTFPVNAVLRRQYDLTKRRYEASLRDAKYLSYMARLAIEQRIGKRLDEIDDAVGPMEAPSTWADDICSFQGIDYKKLSEVKVPEPGGKTSKRDYSQYADPYIGDYVQKLKHFVEFYNIQYPSHEGDDAVVLSVRDDLVGPQGTCYRPSKNLLFHSHDLTAASVEGEGEQGVQAGWSLVSCEPGDGKCLKVTPGKTLKAVQDLNIHDKLAPPGVAPNEGITWLHDVDEPNEVDPGTATATPGLGIPSNSVYQAVDLAAGGYVLSWFDAARGTEYYQIPTSPGEPYRVQVFDANFNQVAPQFSEPAQEGSGSPPTAVWGERRIVPFNVSVPGIHYVVFGASGPGPNKGSVAIADVQLEKAPSSGSVTSYEGTDGTRLVLTGDCVGGSGENFRAAFEYQCNDTSCFYELNQPISIDTAGLQVGNSALVGKIAKGNFNYRHMHLSLNVVGTGVLDCEKTPTPSCYGTGYLEYTFEHDAFSTPIIDHQGQPRDFNFGTAGIFHGKALAAERFITMPIGSADLSLLSQPSFQKPEYRGRPLSGSYRLRIFDSPTLVWNRVEDIQLVLTYRYWARVKRESQTQ